jgi:hypothetical protein
MSWLVADPTTPRAINAPAATVLAEWFRYGDDPSYWNASFSGPTYDQMQEDAHRAPCSSRCFPTERTDPATGGENRNDDLHLSARVADQIRRKTVMSQLTWKRAEPQ